jgi:hypothetical protein
VTELSIHARVLGERLFRLRAKGAAGPGMEEIAGVLLLCASELDRLEQAQDVRAFEATMKERDRARALIASALEKGEKLSPANAWVEIFRGAAAALADEPREEP